MERFDFTQNGGFPFTQNRLAWMQGSYLTALNALGSMSGSDQPRAVLGVELTSGSWATGGTVSDGWVYDPALGLMPFVGGAFTTATVGVNYQDILTPLTFANNSQQNVQIRRVAQIAPGVVPALKTLSESRWYMGFGKVARTAWTTVAPQPGYLGGELNYCVDRLTGMAHFRGYIDRAVGGPAPNFIPQYEIAFGIPAEAATPWQVAKAASCVPAVPIPILELKDWQGNAFSTDSLRIGPAAASNGVSVVAFLWRNLEAAGNYRQMFNFSYPIF